MSRLSCIFIVPIILVGAVSAITAGPPTHFWSKNFGDAGFDYGTAVAVDASGNVFVGGYFQGSIDFGGGAHNAVDNDDMCLAKLDATGAFQWSLAFGELGEDELIDLDTDGSGNVVITGRFPGSVDFGGGTLVSAGGDDAVLAKYDANGNHMWSQRFGGTGGDGGGAVAVDAGDNVIVAGTFEGGVDFGGGTLTNLGGSDIFVAKYDANGSHIWSRSFGNAGNEWAAPIAVDAAGNVYVTGQFEGSVDFGGGNIVSSGGSDAFALKLDSNGNHVWSTGFGGATTDYGWGIDTDMSGNVVVAGVFTDTVSAGPISLASAGGDDIFLVKYDASGTHLWSYGFGGTGDDRGHTGGFDDLGNAIVAGRFNSNDLDFGGGTLPYAGSNPNMYIASFDPSGVHRWSLAWGAGNGYYDWIQMIDTGPSGDLFAAGVIGYAADFGGGPLPYAGTRDIFVVKFNDQPQPAITEISDIGNDEGKQVRLLFNRSGNDDVQAATPVQSYSVYRRDDAPPSSPVVSQLPREGDGPQRLPGGWIYVATAPAHEEESYGVVVPTLADSSVSLGQFYSTFFVRAATDAPGTYFDSLPDSGYSLDNLAPEAPLNFLYETGSITWEVSEAEDFDHYTVYGANEGDFAEAVVIDHTQVPMRDVTASPYNYYFVTATDASGNEGEASMTRAGIGINGTPQNYILSVTSFPNPFNPSTTVKYTVPSPGVVTVEIYDIRGVRVATLVDNSPHDAGAYGIDWNGRSGSGALVSSGIYFARIEHGSAVRSRKLVLLK